MGLPQPNKSDEGRYAAGEKAAPAFLCQSSVRSRQRPQRQAQRRKGEEGVFGQARGMPPAPFHRGMDRERAALDACRVRGKTTRTLRRGCGSATPHRYAAGEKATPAFLSQSSVLSRQRPRRRRKGYPLAGQSTTLARLSRSHREPPAKAGRARAAHVVGGGAGLRRIESYSRAARRAALAQIAALSLSARGGQRR